MADLTEPGSMLSSPSFLQLLQSALGGTKDQTIGKNETTTTDGTQNTSGKQTGTTSQTTDGTNKVTGNVNTTGNTLSQQDTTTQKTADTSALMKVFEQQQAGVSPEMLQAIFTQGAGQVPGLVATLANAVGARQSGNAPLAAGLGTLMAQLTGKAAELTTSQRNASGQTAAAIADATSGQKTTGNVAQQSTQQQATDQLTQLLQNVLGNTAQTTDQATSNTSKSNTAGTTTNNEETQLNSDNLGSLLGVLLGGGVLNSGLEGAGLGGIGSVLSGGASNIGAALAKLLGGGADAGAGTNQSIEDLFKTIEFGGSGSINTGPSVGFDTGMFPATGNQPAFGGGSSVLAPDWWDSEGWGDVYMEPNVNGDY